MKSTKRKLLTILDNIDSIENYTTVKECNFYDMCEIIRYAIEKITSASVYKSLGVDDVVDLFDESCIQYIFQCDIHKMYGAFYRTVKECSNYAEKFSQVEFFKNINKCQSIDRGQTMKSVRDKLVTILDDITGCLSSYTDKKKCNFYDICEIIDSAIVKVTYKLVPISKIIGVAGTRELFHISSDDLEEACLAVELHDEYDVNDMFVAFYHTVAEYSDEKGFSIKKFFENLHNAEVGTFGANKYSRNSWQNIDNAIERYTDAMWRHRLSEGIDAESGLPHYYHELWNMIIV